MTPEQIAALIEYLKNIGEFAVSKGFELAVRQVYANAAIAGLLMLASLLALIPIKWCLGQAKLAMADHDSLQYQGDAEVWGLMTGGFGLAIFGVMFFYNLTNLVRYLMNPEWYAIDLLFKLVTGG